MRKYIIPVLVLLVLGLFVIGGCKIVGSQVSGNKKIVTEEGSGCNPSACSGSCTSGEVSGQCEIKTSPTGRNYCWCNTNAGNQQLQPAPGPTKL